MRKIKRKNQKRNEYKVAVAVAFVVGELCDVDFYNVSSREFKLIEIVFKG